MGGGEGGFGVNDKVFSIFGSVDAAWETFKNGCKEFHFGGDEFLSFGV